MAIGEILIAKNVSLLLGKELLKWMKPAEADGYSSAAKTRQMVSSNFIEAIASPSKPIELASKDHLLPILPSAEPFLPNFPKYVVK
jgi:hypothetical protein